MTGVAAEPMIPAMNSEAQGGRSAVVDLLADLVAFPTESLSTNLDLIDLYAGRAARAGAAIDVLPGEPGRSNLHVRFGPDAPGGILLRGLEAGLAAGGEEGPVHSAALLVHHEQAFALVDLRVDWDDENPVAELRRLWTDYEPQVEPYLLRAVNPAAAPSYGVAGDP
mgnify:CR=1 FL=1